MKQILIKGVEKMRKTLLFAVVLLLALTLPTVFANPHYSLSTVTFDGDIKGVADDVEVWGPSSKIVIEWEPINLTFQDRGVEKEQIDWNVTGHDWDYFEELSQNWLIYYSAYLPEFNYFGELYLRVLKNKGEVTIKYYFGKITSGDYAGNYSYRLVGSGTWSGGRIEVENESFTIYELSYTAKGKKGDKYKTTFDPHWTGLLSFTIEIG